MSPAKKTGAQTSKSPSRLIDARIKELDDWRGAMLSQIRTVVAETGMPRPFNSPTSVDSPTADCLARDGARGPEPRVASVVALLRHSESKVGSDLKRGRPPWIPSALASR